MTSSDGEVRHKRFLLAAGLHRNDLPAGAGDFHRLAVFIELDREVRQVQLIRVGTAPTDGCLDLFHVVLLQDDIGGWAPMPAIRIDRLHLGALFQVG